MSFPAKFNMKVLKVQSSLTNNRTFVSLGLIARKMRVILESASPRPPLVMSGCRCLGQTWGFVRLLYDLMTKWSSNQYKLSLFLFSRSVTLAAC